MAMEIAKGLLAQRKRARELTRLIKEAVEAIRPVPYFKWEAPPRCEKTVTPEGAVGIKCSRPYVSKRRDPRTGKVTIERDEKEANRTITAPAVRCVENLEVSKAKCGLGRTTLGDKVIYTHLCDTGHFTPFWLASFLDKDLKTVERVIRILVKRGMLNVIPPKVGAVKYKLTPEEKERLRTLYPAIEPPAYIAYTLYYTPRRSFLGYKQTEFPRTLTGFLFAKDPEARLTSEILAELAKEDVCGVLSFIEEAKKEGLEKTLEIVPEYYEMTREEVRLLEKLLEEERRRLAPPIKR